jgi:hypothetical protein
MRIVLQIAFVDSVLRVVLKGLGCGGETKTRKADLTA